MVCKYCQGEFELAEKPYISKQAGMEGEYHWNCFVEACRSRMPVEVSIASISNVSADNNESKRERSPAAVED
ncbi:hypothetical protein CEE37_14620 [candidate division LCP-89 bacterium B3_LCP]|uniref:Uncharacterized protein n=1 Tax=candidate division LCP-89 bacterium B3_LCP TaxID=2012998 RepID=A0A532UPT4_UNCL8|nr:MAG: hypothetical protein CEE37_14620 [candidate division LCP-89 bacterium B3_LCP]